MRSHIRHLALTLSLQTSPDFTGLLQWYFPIFLWFFWSPNMECGAENESEPAGIMDGIITQILDVIRPQLSNVYFENEKFETGQQEFGEFRGNVTKAICSGLENFKVSVLKTSLLDINNLTLIEEKFTVKGFYFLNGTLAFPLGKNDIRLFGDGEFRAAFGNFLLSLKVKIRFEDGAKVIKDLDIIIGLEKMELYFTNIMGGGDLEKVFNRLTNDVGLTVFNYYKKPILNVVKPLIKQFLTEWLNK